MTLGIARLARFSESPIARRFAGAAIWSIAGAVVTSGISLLTLILVAQILGKGSYGRFVLLQSTLASVALFAGFGMGNVATRYAAELRERDPAQLSRILALATRCLLVLSIFAVAFLLFGATMIASRIFGSAELQVPIMLAAPAVLLLALDNYYKSLLIVSKRCAH